MSDVYLSDWRPWRVRADQLEKLNKKDPTAIYLFYNENIHTLKHYAIYYYGTRGQSKHLYRVEDMLQDAYLDMFDSIDFKSVSFFQTSLKSAMYYSAFGGRWNRSVKNAYFNRENRDGFFHTYTILDDPLFDDSEETRADRIRGGANPYTEMIKERERQRMDKLEKDLDPILRRIFTPNQYERWSSGLNIGPLRAVIRRHSEEILDFLRKHGTSDRKLQGHIVTAEEERSELDAKKARIVWEEENLDQLSEAKRREVIQRIRLRERRRAKAAKKRAEAINK